MAWLLRWVLGIPLLVLVFALISDVLVEGESAGAFVLSALLGEIAGLSGWIAVFQPLAATIGLVAAGLVAGLAFGLPVGLLWGRHHPWSSPLGLIVVVCLGAFPLGLGIFFLHKVVVDLGWIVPGYLAIDRGGGVGVAGRYLLGVACMAPLVAGEIAVVFGGEIRRAVGDRRQEYSRSLGMPRGAVFPRWAIPPALMATCASLPALVAVLFSWAAAIEWIFHVGGLGRVVVRSGLEGDLSGALSGILVMVILVSLLRSVCHAAAGGGRWATAPVYGCERGRPPAGSLEGPLARRVWRWRFTSAAVFLVLVPCFPVVFSWMLPIGSWDAAHLGMREILGSEVSGPGGTGDEGGESGGYGGRLLVQAFCAGYAALAGAVLSVLLGGIWGLVAAVAGRRRLLGRVLLTGADLLAGIPMALLLLVLVVSADGGAWGARCLLVGMVAARLVRAVERTVLEAMPTGYLEAAEGLAQGRMLALVRAVGEPISAASLWWVVGVLHWWLYVPALVSFLDPAAAFLMLGQSAGTGMETLWEEPLVALAPCLLLGILGAGFNLVRILLPDRSVDGRTSLR